MSGRRCQRCLVTLSSFERVYCVLCEDLSLRGISPSAMLAFREAQRLERDTSAGSVTPRHSSNRP
jgi:hypothetical protein